MLIWKALHMVSKFTMVAGFIGVEVFYAAAIRSRDVHKVAWVQRTLQNTGFGPLALIALVAGIVFGLLTAATGGFALAVNWLIAACVLVGLFLVNAILVGEKVVRAGNAAIEPRKDGVPPRRSWRRCPSTARSSSWSPSASSSWRSSSI